MTTPHTELTELAENLHVIQHIPQRYFSALCTSSVFFLYELDKFDEFFVAYGERQPTVTQSVAERNNGKTEATELEIGALGEAKTQK